VAWGIEFSDECAAWWSGLDAEEQDAVSRVIRLLEERGPTLPFPYSSGIETSRHRRMRELRVQHAGRPFRVLYAFDPNRVALLLIGGDKTGRTDWYEEFVPIADRLYDEHLRRLQEVRKRGK
jgi:hypothetical protein